MAREKERRIYGLIVTALLSISLLAPVLFLPGVQAQSIEMWSDTFADASKIYSSTNVTQVTDSGDFGTSFIPYSGNPLLTLETCDPWDAHGDVTRQIPGAVHPDVIYFPQGMDGFKFWMMFTPLNGSLPPGISGISPDDYWELYTLVRSNDGINWVKTPDYTNPVISPAGWDATGNCDPDIVYVPSRGWFLYYCAGGSFIGVATSSDGLHYTKYVGPFGGAIIPSYSACPTVVYNEGTGIFHMWFNWAGVGGGQLSYATSTDGLNWTPYNPDSPGTWGYIVFQKTPGTFDQYGISHSNVIYYQGQYWIYYLAQPISDYAQLVIGLAKSPDGIHWTKHPTPVLTPGHETWKFTGDGTTVVGSLYHPAPVMVGDTMYMYYGGTDSYWGYLGYPPGCPNYETGLAFSTPPDGHVELERESNLHTEYPTRGEAMAWYHFNEGGTAPPPTYPGEYQPASETLAWYHFNEGEPTYPGVYQPTDQTLAWYHFNEGSGTTVGDSSGNENNGALEGSPAWATGLHDGGLSFDGDDRVTVPDSASLNPTENITIEAWVSLSVQKPVDYVVSKVTDNGGDYSYGLYLNNGEIQAFIRPSSGGAEYYSYGGSVPVGTWTHIAMTYGMNSTADTHIKLYQNGIEVSYSNYDTIPAGTNILTNAGNLNIGCLPIGAWFYYQGTLDDVRILDKALSADEVKADGGITLQVVDSSGNGNNGTLAGPTWTTGLYSYGLSFDGDDRVTVPDSASLNPTENITIEAWVNPSVHKQNNYIVIKMNPGTGDYAYGLYVQSLTDSSSEIQAFIRPSSGGTEYYTNGGNVPVGTWTHIAMTYQMDPAASTRIRIYQNGVEVTPRSYDPIPAGTNILTNAGPLNLGVIPISTPRYYSGTIDEVRVVGRALSADEIEADGGIYAPEVTDSSDNGNHGSRVGGVSWITGLISYGLDFDGSSGYVNVPDSTSLNPTENITIEAWVNPSVIKRNSYILIKMTPRGTDYSYGLALENTTGYLEIVPFIRPSSGGAEYYSYGGNVPLNTWTHIAMTYEMDPTTSTRIRIYQNGVEVLLRAFDSIPAGTHILTNTGPLTVGCIPWVDYYRYYDGTMDELRILNRALSAYEILADYGGYKYKSQGNLTSVLITPGIIWDKFYVTDERPSGTSIQYSILDEAGDTLIPSVGNDTDISSLGTTPIRLHAELATGDPSFTPILSDWSVTYQVEAPPNTPPVASGLIITPSSPYTTNNLVGSYSYSDADGDPESGSEIRWYMGDVLQPLYNDVLIVSSTSLAQGQVWYFTVRPRDGTDLGTLQTSPSVTIRTSIFSDGFETGTIPGSWTTVYQSSGLLTASTGQVHHGSYSARADVTANGGYAVVARTLSPILPVAYMRAYVYFTAFPANTFQTSFLRSSGGAGVTPASTVVAAAVYNDGGVVKWALVYENIVDYRITANTPLPQLNTWYSVEIKTLVHGTSGEARMYVNNVEILAQTGLDNDAYANVGYVVAGSSALPIGTNGISTFYIDCVIVGDEYIGTEEELPPPPDDTPPTYSSVGANTTWANQPTLFHARWTDNVGLSGFIFSTDNTGTWTNDTWTPLIGPSSWSNVTKILNPTIGAHVQYRFYSNDTSNNWNLTPIQSLTTIGDATPPAYSNVGTNTTWAGQLCLFHARWTDEVGLSGYVFGTNSTGTWINETWTPINGLSGWSNATKILGSTAGVLVQYRFYCNDTSDNWSSTPILSLTLTEQPTVYASDLSISASSTSALVGYRVNIVGRLAFRHNSSGIANAPIELYYRIIGQNWNILTATTTASDGSYYATWFPMWTGNHHIRAVYASDEPNLLGSETMISLIIMDIDEQIFSISSNSTVSGLSFNSTLREINFNLEGPSSTTGYLNIFLSKQLVPDINELRIYFDEAQKSYESTSVDNVWFIHLTYSHSVHTLRITLAPASLTSNFAELATRMAIVSLIALVASVTLLALFRKKKIAK